MSDVYYGQPATITSFPMPPVAVNIVSSSNASPTVITATAHGLRLGDVVIINGHLVNTAVNGIRIATPTGADTFKVSTFAGFLTNTYINAAGAGAATGSSQGLGFPGITMPEDLADMMDASSVNVPFEALADMTAWLAYQVHTNLKRPYVVLPDANFTVGFNADLFNVPDVAALRVYTLPDPTGIEAVGRRAKFRFYRNNGEDTNDSARVFYGGIIATLAGGNGGPSWVEVESTAVGTYNATGWGGNVTIA